MIHSISVLWDVIIESEKLNLVLYRLLCRKICKHDGHSKNTWWKPYINSLLSELWSYTVYSEVKHEVHGYTKPCMNGYTVTYMYTGKVR